jgi:TM2 domain-containing membrane protein YozV
MIVAFGFTALFYWLFNETITLISISLIGLVFIATNRIWLGKIGKNFEKSKYYRLECFREE